MKRIFFTVVFFVLALFFFSAPVRAGQYFQDFSPYPTGTTSLGDGSALLSNLLGPVASVQDATYKELQLTTNGVSGMRSALLLPDLNPGTPVYAFSVKWNADVNGNFPNAGDGFSFNFGQLSSLDLAGTGYSQEAGFGTGLSFGVQTYFGNNPGFYLRVNGTNAASIAYNASTQWGTNNPARHFFEVDWNYTNGLSVRMDGTNIFTNIATTNFTPHAGDCMVWAARCGTFNQEVRLDNIVVMTGGNLIQIPTSSPYYKSGEYTNANQTADKAFDGDIATKWLTLANTGYVGATVSPAATVAAYALTSGEDVPGRDPQTWTVDGSNNGGSAWTSCASGSGYFFSRNETRAGLANNPASFGAYRLNISANNGDPYIQLAEMQFYQFIPVAVTPPVLKVSATPLVYVEGDGLVAIGRTLTLSDTNTTTLTGATVQITGNYQSDQDVLGFVNTPQITGNFVPANGTLTLTGTTTAANYQAALRTVTYQNTSGYPLGANGLVDTGGALSTARTVTWTVTDDQPASGSNTNSITVYNVNSAPVITSAGNFAFINGNSQDINIPHYFGLSFADVDAFDSPFIDFEITITGNSLGVHDTSPSLNGFPKNVSGAVVTANSIKFSTSIALANTYVANLYFQTKKAGVFAVTVTVNDNGFTGGAPPPSLATSWPQTTVQVIDFAWVTTVTGGIDVTHPGDTVQATSANSPDGQGATNAIDNTVATQYRNLDKLNTGFTITPTGTNIVRGLTLISAGDAPERNPASYLLEGSPDGTTFTMISSNTVPAFISTNSIQSFSFLNSTAYPIYRLTFPTVANAVAADSMQIGEVELLAQTEITSPNDLISVTLPSGAVVVNGVAGLIDRQLGLTNKFDVASIAAGSNTVVDLVPAVGPSVLTGFELIGGADDLTYPGRRPSSFSIAGSVDGTNFTTLSLTIAPAVPSANSQIQEFSVSGFAIAYAHYRLTFGAPVSGDQLQVGEIRLFGSASPQLGFTKSASQLVLSWPVSGFILQQSTNLASANWFTATNGIVMTNGQNTVTIPYSTGNNFYRLKSQ